jgi:hypothetical protein
MAAYATRRSVGRAGPALDVPGCLDPIDQPGDAAGGERYLLGQRAHGQLPALGTGEPYQYLEPDVW